MTAPDVVGQPSVADPSVKGADRRSSVLIGPVAGALGGFAMLAGLAFVGVKRARTEGGGLSILRVLGFASSPSRGIFKKAGAVIPTTTYANLKKALKQPYASYLWIDPSEVAALDNLDPDKIVAEGAFAVVRRGTVRGLSVAIKEIPLVGADRANLEVFTRELEVLAQMQHHRVIKMLGYSHDDTRGRCPLGGILHPALPPRQGGTPRADECHPLA